MAENLGKGTGPGSVAAGEVGKFDVRASHVTGNPRLRTGNANVADAPQDPLSASDGGEELLIAEAVLEGADHGVGFQQGWDKIFQVSVAGGFHAYQNQIDWADLLRGSVSARGMEMKVAKRTAHLDAVFLEMDQIPSG